MNCDLCNIRFHQEQCFEQRRIELMLQHSTTHKLKSLLIGAFSLAKLQRPLHTRRIFRHMLKGSGLASFETTPMSLPLFLGLLLCHFLPIPFLCRLARLVQGLLPVCLPWYFPFSSWLFSWRRIYWLTIIPLFISRDRCELFAIRFMTDANYWLISADYRIGRSVGTMLVHVVRLSVVSEGFIVALRQE